MLEIVLMPLPRPIPEQKPPAKQSSALAGYVGFEKILNLAFVMLAAFLICWAVGWWVDHHFHQHWATIVGILLGCVAGLYSVVQQAIAAEKNSRKANPPQNGSGDGSQP
jgi:F0F1-type ATP synthase assembly protein I